MCPLIKKAVSKNLKPILKNWFDDGAGLWIN